MIFYKVVIDAARLSGGPRAVFQAHDVVTKRYSEPRLCISLRRNSVMGNFSWPYPSGNMRGVFRIRGMWDMLREMPLSFYNSVDLKTWGEFEVRLNGRRVFRGTGQFMNYRSWRFWPALEIDLGRAQSAPAKTNSCYSITPGRSVHCRRRAWPFRKNCWITQLTGSAMCRCWRLRI